MKGLHKYLRSLTQKESWRVRATTPTAISEECVALLSHTISKGGLIDYFLTIPWKPDMTYQFKALYKPYNSLLFCVFFTLLFFLLITTNKLFSYYSLLFPKLLTTNTITPGIIKTRFGIMWIIP